MKPEFSNCAECGRRIARLSERERWHHVDRSIEYPNARTSFHVPKESAMKEKR